VALGGSIVDSLQQTRHVDAGILLYKARGGPHASFCPYICLSVSAAHHWDARHRFTHTGYNGKTNGLRERPEFRRILTTKILRTCLHAQIKCIQNRERRSTRAPK